MWDRLQAQLVGRGSFCPWPVLLLAPWLETKSPAATVVYPTDLLYVLSGQLEHKDSIGNGRIIQTGDGQYMAAGTGVRPSEFNPSREKKAHFLQIWIKPDQLGATPRYAGQSFKNADSGKLHLVTSKTGREGSIAINQDADLWLAKLESSDRGRPYAESRTPRLGAGGGR